MVEHVEIVGMGIKLKFMKAAGKLIRFVKVKGKQFGLVVVINIRITHTVFIRK